jgi:hypothetical protein
MVRHLLALESDSLPDGVIAESVPACTLSSLIPAPQLPAAPEFFSRGLSMVFRRQNNLAPTRGRWKHRQIAPETHRRTAFMAKAAP